MGTMATHLGHVAEEAARKEWSYQEFFEKMLQAEHRERQERSRILLTKTAVAKIRDLIVAIHAPFGARTCAS
jgi:hypothetical protein